VAVRTDQGTPTRGALGGVKRRRGVRKPGGKNWEGWTGPNGLDLALAERGEEAK